MKFKLKEELTKQKLTQTELAKILGVAPSLINRYSLGKLEPSMQMLCEMADVLHVSADELLGRETNLINLEVMPEEEKTLIKKIMNMNQVQKAQTINFVNALTMFEE